MCQMRAIKEYKERSGDRLDFMSNHYLHYIAAEHTDNFENVMYGNTDEVSAKVAGYQSEGYDKMIEFRVDWGKACQVGILRAWCEDTLGFTPSTDKPYFILYEHEQVTARSQYGLIMERKGPFRKSMILNLESVSAYSRGFRIEDWNRVLDMIPKDVAIFYPVPITWTYGNPFPARSNLFVLPGYPIGETGGLHQCVDVVFVVHSGPLMIATAVDAKCIVEINFNDGGSPQLISPPKVGEKICFNNNREVDWNILQNIINKWL